MTENFRICVPYDEKQLDALSAAASWAFVFPQEEWRKILCGMDSDSIRLALDGTKVVGGLFYVSMAQYFGGQTVPMVGIAGVVVLPEYRGRGVARKLLEKSLAELSMNGIALSALFPASLRVYRSVGYELAGTRHRFSLRPDEIAPHKNFGDQLVVRPASTDDEKDIVEAYRAQARHFPGHLDRNDYMWSRVRRERKIETRARGYVIERAGELEGYLYVAQRADGPGRYDLDVTDFVVRSANAGRHLLAFLWDHRSLVNWINFYGGPGGPFPLLLPERSYTTKQTDGWMLRLVDVEAALTTRGYPRELDATVELELIDDVVPMNAKRLVLAVSGGRGEVTSGGKGTLQIDTRALASLYSGFAAARDVELAELASGDADSLQTLERIFAGPSPWMPDSF